MSFSGIYLKNKDLIVEIAIYKIIIIGTAVNWKTTIIINDNNKKKT